MNISLVDKRKALDDYLKKRDAFSSVDELDKFESPDALSHRASGSGVFGFALTRDRSIHFVTLKSVPRGIPERVWKVPLPVDLSLVSFAIYPQADVLAVVCFGLE